MTQEEKVDLWMPFYVGDYLADTMHLSAAEHGGYLMLILHYWKSGPIPDDDARLAIISRLGDAWGNASGIIRAFFKHRDGMLVHDRIDREKVSASSNKSKKVAKAKAAADARWKNNAQSNACGMPQVMHGECPSPSPSPSPKGELKSNSADAPKYSAKDDLLASGVAEQTASDWLKLRAAKKAPATKTALDAVRKEAAEAGLSLDSALQICCTRGWQGFKAAWVTQNGGASPQKTKGNHGNFSTQDYRAGVSADGKF